MVVVRARLSVSVLHAEPGNDIWIRGAIQHVAGVSR